jgi:signal transduction histidine kinase
VTIAAKQRDKAVLFEVSDTGIGISKSDQERVFDKFFRSEDFRTRQTNGTGLGLYVTAKLARLIHADINLKSDLNKGSTFSILIPDIKA